MPRVAIIEEATGRVVNIADVEDGANWNPPADHIAVAHEQAAIGMVYKDGEFSAPDPENDAA